MTSVYAKGLWFFHRLTCMSLPEIGHRVKSQIQMEYERHRFRRAGAETCPEPSLTAVGRWLSPPRQLENHQAYTASADRILAGHLDIFDMEVDAYEVLRHWNRDPKTGTDAPVAFGKTLDYRDPLQVGDIKYLWEPNRHLHLVSLAQAYHLSKNDIYLRALRLHLESWIDQCPFMLGPNWCSSLELAIRLINWSVAWQLIGGVESPLFSGVQGEAFRRRWLAAVYQHMVFISRNFSRYSSANNHLIGEAAGLFVASNTWPCWPGTSDHWRKAGFDILVEETTKQICPDGVGREQAVAYLQFVLDFLLLSLLSGKAAGVSLPDDCLSAMENALVFLASIMDIRGNIPMIGDADDGMVTKLSQERDFCPCRSLLATGAAIFHRSDFLEKAERMDDKTQWLLGDAAPVFLQNPRKLFKIRQSFPQGGYYIFGDDLGTEREIRGLVDAGPIGYLSIAAHGHADALSLYLSVGGVEFLVDPGTYNYHGKREWRDYFRGTSAHNTVRIDRVDQSVSGGNFMWTFKANAEATFVDFTADRDGIAGHHDGYQRLPDPVIHKREVTFNKKQALISVLDTIECREAHTVERCWHFHEHCKVVLTGQDLIAENDGAKIRIRTMESDSNITVYRGDSVLPQGWISRRYDAKVPADAAVVENRVRETTSLRTEIQILAMP